MAVRFLSRRKRSTALRKPVPPPEGMLYNPDGHLISADDVQTEAQVRLLGFDKNDRRHYTNDFSYWWKRN